MLDLNIRILSTKPYANINTEETIGPIGVQDNLTRDK